MPSDLTPRMHRALRKLRDECDYEDSRVGGTDNYVLANHLAPGVGNKTLSDLLALGLIESGTNRWHHITGYRITDRGRSAL